MKEEIQVQVVCVTYNQQEYIAQALDSFLMQKTTFRFEVIVGDDCSTDGTSAIVAEYARKYPDIIRHIRRSQNMGCLENFMDLCESLTAKYAAFCDGDDYWTDEYKLQKQFEYMEKNEDVNLCAHLTKVLVKESCSLYNYYKNSRTPFIYSPTLLIDQKATVNDFVKQCPHTSSLFIRWKQIEFPNWAKTNGVGGDLTVMFLQLGKGYFYVFNEVMSEYRKVESGVIFSCGSMDELFIQSRRDHFRVFLGITEYFNLHYDGFGVRSIEGRLQREIVNYVNAIVNLDRWDLLLELKESFPTIYPRAKNILLQYRLAMRLKQSLGEKRLSWVNRGGRLKIVREFVRLMYQFDSISEKVKKAVRKQIHRYVGYLFFNKNFYLAKNPDVAAVGMDPRKHFFTLGWKEGRRAFDSAYSSPLRLALSFLCYWAGALVPKKKNLWVFSSFYKRGYLDNTKYLFEYIMQHHPEIHAVWMTRDQNVLRELRERGLPVGNMRSLSSRWLMLRAELAFTDHFVRSDYENRYGFNARTKVVQLWHGVGLKTMTLKGDIIANTTVPGVRLSSDILPSTSDSRMARLKKKLLYFFIAPFRELEEHYYAFLCPGQEHVKFLVKPWRIPEKTCIFSGHPRNIFLHSSPCPEKVKIIYAPTFRWNPTDETAMIDRFIEAIPDISEFLERMDGEFVLRLHPHTWRNYQKRILPALEGHERISMDRDKDVYTSLGSYSLMISDYSSIAFDFVLLNRPIVFFVPDRATFMEHDVSFNYPFDEYTPGPKVDTWQDVLAELAAYVKQPDKDDDWRQRVRAEFYDMSVNDADNSKRIVETLKQRLKI